MGEMGWLMLIGGVIGIGREIQGMVYHGYRIYDFSICHDMMESKKQRKILDLVWLSARVYPHPLERLHHMQK